MLEFVSCKNLFSTVLFNLKETSSNSSELDSFSQKSHKATCRSIFRCAFFFFKTDFNGTEFRGETTERDVKHGTYENTLFKNA